MSLRSVCQWLAEIPVRIRIRRDEELERYANESLKKFEESRNQVYQGIFDKYNVKQIELEDYIQWLSMLLNNDKLRNSLNIYFVTNKEFELGNLRMVSKWGVGEKHKKIEDMNVLFWGHCLKSWSILLPEQAMMDLLAEDISPETMDLIVECPIESIRDLKLTNQGRDYLLSLTHSESRYVEDLDEEIAPGLGYLLLDQLKGRRFDDLDGVDRNDILKFTEAFVEEIKYPLAEYLAKKLKPVFKLRRSIKDLVTIEVVPGRQSDSQDLETLT